MITSTQIGLRHIPCVEQSFDCVRCPKGPEPVINTEDKILILKNTYASTSSDYRQLNVITRSASAHRKAPFLTNIHYMTNVKDSLYSETLSPPSKPVSVCHESYLPKERYPSLGYENCISFVDERCIPKTQDITALPAGAPGITRFLDQYISVNRLNHRAFVPYDPEKTITFYTDVLEKKEKRPPDPSKNMCLGQGRPDVRINYDRNLRKAPAALMSGMSSSSRSAYPHPITTSQNRVKDLLNVGIRWNDSKYLPFKCQLY